VLVDIVMPVMDGYATIRAMRNVPSGRDLPVLAVTANVTPGQRQRCIDAGASEYVSKPIETDDLMGCRTAPSSVTAWTRPSRPRTGLTSRAVSW
jgi:CheY-like chemotaxis protein